MSTIISAIPGFTIKTKDGLIFKGTKLLPPFVKNVEYDIENNPHRWELEYEKEETMIVDTPVVDTPVVDEVPTLPESTSTKSEASVKATAQSATKRKKISTK